MLASNGIVATPIVRFETYRFASFSGLDSVPRLFCTFNGCLLLVLAERYKERKG